VAEALLQGEGVREVHYLKHEGGAGIYKAVASGEVDVGIVFSGPLILRVDAGDPIVMVAGAHIGCLELVATDQVHAIRDLKGQTVAVLDLGGVEHVFLASMAAYVGLDPQKDMHWVTQPRAEAVGLLTEGQIEALLISPPGAPELRAQQIGHVVVNTSVDRPWSQYFCCVVAGNWAFVRTHPAATKRALGAILKAAAICALEPDRVAQSLVDKGLTPRYDSALQSLKDVPDGQKLIAQGTEWRFLTELKRELKG
jgi:NitT/TauT family transport system substrate-binding protein